MSKTSSNCSNYLKKNSIYYLFFILGFEYHFKRHFSNFKNVIKIPACVPAVFVSIAKSLVFPKSYAKTVNLAVAEGSRTVFPERVRERKKKKERKSYGRKEDLIDRTTAGKGQLSREFCRGNQVISRGTSTTRYCPAPPVPLTLRKRSSRDHNDEGRVGRRDGIVGKIATAREKL